MVAANDIFAPSHSFIRQHILEISPEKTGVITNKWPWGVPGFDMPVLDYLDPWPARFQLADKLRDGIQWRFTRKVNPILGGANERRVRQFLLDYEADVVLAEFGPLGVAISSACQRAGIPLVVHFHGYDATMLTRKRYWRNAYTKLFRVASGIIVPSHFLASKLLQIRCPKEKLHISPHGVDIKNFRSPEEKPDELKIVSVARLAKVKGPDLLIRAFAMSAASRLQVKLALVGAGPMEAECRTLAEELNISDKVEFLGPMSSSEVAALLKRASLFVQHSIRQEDGQEEAFGIAPLEAMACGVPVVVSNSGGLAENVIDQVTGIVVKMGSITETAAAIDALIQNSDLRYEMGLKAQRHASSNYSSENTIAHLRKLLVTQERGG